MSETNPAPGETDKLAGAAAPKSKTPIFIAAGALLALLIVVGLIAALVSRTGESGVPIDQTSAALPPLELPECQPEVKQVLESGLELLDQQFEECRQQHGL